VEDSLALWKDLEANGYQRNFVQKAQVSMKWALGAVVALMLVGYLTIFHAIPWVSVHVAAALPESVDTFIGDKAWPDIEKELLKPTKLSPQRQQELKDGFAAMTAQIPDAPKYQLIFGASNVGANAFAIPGGRIIMTDELIKLSQKKNSGGDQAIYGVLLHELGHVKYRHTTRRLVESATLGVVISVWLGDVSNLVAIIPTTLAAMKYSRELEEEADTFAAANRKRLGISGEPMALMFERMATEMGDADEKFKILSSHPVTKERVKRFRELQGSSNAPR
jgi:Zn-dependent protease with chaperone function